jgi:superfamily II DNA or RNA helicase
MSTNLSNVDSLFLFYSTGAGKTCTAVLAAEYFINHISSTNNNGKVYIISNKSAKEEFINTIIGECGNVANDVSPNEENKYISNEELDKLESSQFSMNLTQYKKFRKNTFIDKLTTAGYKFFTFQSFSRPSIYNKIQNFNDSLIIIDEAHTMLHKNKYFQSFNDIKEKSQRYKILLLSATPMINTPLDIVNFINIMYKTKDQISDKDVFPSTVANNMYGNINVKIIVDKLKGRVSYLNLTNSDRYPRRIDVGVGLKGLLKYTKIVRVPMGEYQYNNYIKHWDGYTSPIVKSLANFVFPGGLVSLNDLEYKYSTLELRGMGIHIINNKYGKVATGNFLHLNKIGKYSCKYEQLLKDIIANYDGHSLIFSRRVKDIGTNLIVEMLKMNGFVEYGDTIYNKNVRSYSTHKINNGEKDFIPCRFAIFHNNLTSVERDNIIKIFTSKGNSNGELIKIFIGSELIKESLNLKRIRYVYIMEYQENFSKLEQIIGRAIRFDSHIDVDPKTFVYKYVCSLPSYISFSTSEYDKYLKIIKDGVLNNTKDYINISNKTNVPWTSEELEYYKDELLHVNIKKIERVIKTIALDCNANKDTYDPKLYDYKRECDYMKCNYTCLYDDYNFDNIYDINSTSSRLLYDIFYRDIEVSNIIGYIKDIFHDIIIINRNILIDMLVSRYGLRKYFISLALQEMIDKYKNDEYSITNKYNVKGYIQYSNNHYLFHPSNINETELLNINMRGPGAMYHSSININLTKHIARIMKVEDESVPVFTSMKIILDNISKVTKNEQFITIINDMSLNDRVSLIELAINKYNSGVKFPYYIYNILRHYKYYLIDENIINGDSYLINNNFDSIDEGSYFYEFKTSGSVLPDKNKHFTGHIVGVYPKILRDEKFAIYQFNNVILNRPINDYIIGIAEKEYGGELITKLKYIDNESSRGMDKRKILKGFKCTQINSKKNIKEIYKNLLPDKDVPNIKITKFCEIIEAVLRKKQFNDKNFMWFYDFHIIS